MRIRIECFRCIAQQIVDIVEKHITDQNKQYEVVQFFFSLVGKLPREITPPQVAGVFFDHLRVKYGLYDPYNQQKQQSNIWVKQHLDQVRQHIRGSANSLKTALLYAAIGNIIDYGIPVDFDIQDTLTLNPNQTFTVDYSTRLINDLSSAKTVVLIGDNAGEIGFDYLLLEEIQRNYSLKLYYLVRGGPILNDATEEDAQFFEIDRIATVLNTGSTVPGVIVADLPSAVNRIFQQSSVVIAKGQGNFETLSDCSRVIYFLLTTKCSVVSNHINVPLNSTVLLESLS